ncbi:hypothetical protein JCM9279_003350 [Rhodotorula babjevae]
MRASYSSLPDEVIGIIVDMVNEQDRAWDRLAVKRGFLFPPPAVPTEFGDVLNKETEPTSVIAGRWSPYFGRGIRALVQLDRRTRLHAVKHFYKTITAKQAAADYCRYAVLGEQLGELVREVDLDLDLHHAIDPFSLACAMRKLKNVTGLIVDDSALKLAFPLVFPEERKLDEASKLLGLSILDALGRLTSFVALSVEDELLERALSATRSAILSRLAFDNPSSLVPLSDELVAALNGLESLTDLDLGDMSPTTLIGVQERVRLEHVQTLTLGRASVEAYLDEALVLAHHIAPRAKTLRIESTLVGTSAFVRPDLALPNPLLPALRVLDVQHAARYLDGFHEIRLPSLEHLHLAFDDSATILPYDADYLAPAPTSLRSLTISYASLKRLAPAASLITRCADLDIHLSIHRRLASPEALTQRRYVRSDTGFVAAPYRPQALALEETLTWARNRARWLREMGDGPGLQELAEAAVRLRERHVVHES